VVVPNHITTVFIQVAEPGEAAVVLSSTPVDSEDINIDKTTVAFAITTWESGKAACISSGTWSNSNIP